MGWVLFFDGDCAFCTASVRWVFRVDRRGKIDFAPLQGVLAEKLGVSKCLTEGGGTMALLRELDGRVFTRSGAWIELFRALGGFWRVFTVLRWIPSGMRDGVYGWVARNRHRIMGKANYCELPDPELAKRLRS